MHQQDYFSTNVHRSQITIEQARLQFLLNGYDPIPLKAQTKIPVSKRWQSLSTLYQWDRAEPNVNIGLRAGNGRAFIDCDDKKNPQTSGNVTRWLSGLGVQDYPKVQTPSMGNHIYVELDTEFAGSSKNLLPDMGTGEFRYGSGAQVGTFPSVTDVGHYVLVSGDIARLPKLSRADIAGIISGQVEPQKQHMTALAHAIATGQQGVLQGRYKGDRSTAEAGLVLSLINTGHTFEQIRRIFDTYPCMGHYQEHRAKSEKEANRWLWLTYQNELAYSRNESPIRRMIAGLIAGTRLSAWGNANQKQVYLAHLERAYKAGNVEYSMSVRDTALSARVGLRSAMNQTKKLVTEGLLEKAEPVQGTNTFKLAVPQIDTYPCTPPCEDMYQNAVLKSDAFRNGGGKVRRLGKRAGEIYALLLQQPLTIAEITKRVGCSRDTVERKLKQMSFITDHKTGEVIEMVSRDGNVWYANKVDLELVSVLVGAYKATERQAKEYEEDRQAHKQALAKKMRDEQIKRLEAG